MIYMLSVKKLIRSEKRHQLLLGIVFVLYILLNVQTPKMIAGLVDNLVGNVVIVLVALTILMNSHPVVGVLSLVVAYELIRRSSGSVVVGSDSKYLLLDKKSSGEYDNINNIQVTLEEDMVSKMATIVHNDDPPNSEYTPVLDDLHDAAGIDYEGVI